MKEPWWAWYWDRMSAAGTVTYKSVVRWRRGWVTVYKLVIDDAVEWKVCLPFNVSIGIELDKQ